MSALVFRKHSSYTQCATEGCIKAGRYSMLIAGYPVMSHSPYATAQARELLCPKCKAQAVRCWDEAAGLDQEQMAA